MEIFHLGHSCFRIKGKQTILVLDPFDPQTSSIKISGITADIVTVSHDHHDHNYIQAVSGKPLVISGPGEYEIKGVRIAGIMTYHDTVNGSERGKNIVYHIEVDGLSVVHLGDLGHILTTNQEEQIGDTDVLLIPVGGFFTIGPKEAVRVIAQLEPRVVIPMHYRTSSLSGQIAETIESVETFLKEIGKAEVIPQSKYSIAKDKLPAEQMIVVLE